MTPDEKQKVAQIIEITYTTELLALNVLRRKNGNLEQAIDAIFTGDTGEAEPKPANETDMEALRTSVAGVVAPGASVYVRYVQSQTERSFESRSRGRRHLRQLI